MPITEDVRVYWSCAGRHDILRVRNLSLGGIFVETRKLQSIGATAQIEFLVEEGQIRTKAVVRHAEGAAGMGLEFTALAQDDRLNFAALLIRLRGLSRS